MTIADNICKCGSTTSPKVKVVRGNDLVIEAKASLWSEESQSYEAYSLDGAAGLKMYLVGDYGRVECADVAADGATARGKVCGRALGKGVYGVELTFGDEGGHGRIYEAGVLEIVESGEEATTVSTAEGEGVPFTVEVDMVVRTVRIGKVAATDSYDALTDKPSIDGKMLSGEMSLSDIGAAAAADIPTKVSQLDNDRGYLTEHQSLADYAKTADVDAALADKAGKTDFDAEVSAREATDAIVTAVSGRVDTLNNAVNKQGETIASVRDRVSAVENGKQDNLVSGTNIKTVNGKSLLGSGDIVIEGGSGGGGTVQASQLWTPTQVSKVISLYRKVTGAEFDGAITEDEYNLLESLPEVGYVGLYTTGYDMVVNKGPILRFKDEGILGVPGASVLIGLSKLPYQMDKDLVYIKEESEGEILYGCMPFTLGGDIPDTVKLTANSDGTFTSAKDIEECFGGNSVTAFPVMIVKKGSSYYANNIHYCVAHDVQTMKSPDSYSSNVKYAFFSLNGVYYKWSGTTLTPVQSAVAQTPVVYSFVANTDGTFNDVGKDDIEELNIIDELLFKAKNPSKSNLMVKVVKDGAAYWLSTFKYADDTISCTGYVPDSSKVITLSITSAGKVSMTETSGGGGGGDYLPLTGGTCTGGVIAANFQTGTPEANYFQTKKLRGQGDANAYNHAIDFGYAGHDRVDFYEYGGLWNFYQCQSSNKSAARLIGSIKHTTGWNGPAALTGTPTAPTAGAGTNTTQIATTEFVQAALPTVPTKVSAFTNDSGYQTASDVQTLINNAVTTALNTEV